MQTRFLLSPECVDSQKLDVNSGVTTGLKHASCHQNLDNSCLLGSRRLFNRLLVIRYALLRLIKLQMRNFILKHETTSPPTKPPTSKLAPKQHEAPQNPPECLLTILLKLFLITCYFVATFGSLLLLIQLYSTYHEASGQQQQPSGISYALHAQINSPLPENKTLHFRDVSELKLEHGRHKRSLNEDYSLSPEGSNWSSERVGGEEKAVTSSRVEFHTTPSRNQKSNFSRQISPQLNKLAGSSNAFHLPVTSLDTDNDWIPIVESRTTTLPRLKPYQEPSSKSSMPQATWTSFGEQKPIHDKTVEQHSAQVDTLLSESKFSNQYYQPHSYKRNRHQPAFKSLNHEHHMLTPPQFNHFRHQPREPRFNLFRGQPAKLYRRVLLCEKSLVSLEYVKHQPNLEHQLHYESDFNFDDNSLDFESANFADPMYAAASSGSVPPDLEDRSMLAANLSGAPTSGDLLASSSHSSRFVNARRQPAAHRRHNHVYLTDDDPLVGCDMWDLEKGLKNRKPPHFILRMAVRTDFDTLRDAINRCRQLSEKNVPMDEDSSYRDGFDTVSTEDLVSLMSVKRGLIPGTKWCGLGDQATSYNDLGPKHRIDICCRAHDHCPIRLKPFRNDYGVLNIALYTKSHCDCDADFYRCLRDARSKTADMLGNLYFNVMKLQCIREERVKVCREMRPIALGFERCVRYEDSPGQRVFRFTTPPVAY